jgi:hypothetical protein
MPGLIASGQGDLWLAGETAATLLPASSEQGILMHSGSDATLAAATAASWMAAP